MDIGETRGMMKVVVDAETDQILGRPFSASKAEKS
jgi:pyruvate/2-oxoglutarate dehydrogenase complex dihydrolipoamide dehydrogenase (E3) component